ncbi:hypothetical protein ACVJGD_000584 [Bradyrhizobium sp. USDA 10063]
MSKPKLLSAALIVAAMLATPALAREHHVRARHFTANAYAAAIGTGHNDLRPCYGNLAGDLRGELCGYGDRDMWGHWGGYYGPMVHVP